MGSEGAAPSHRQTPEKTPVYLLTPPCLGPSDSEPHPLVMLAHKPPLLCPRKITSRRAGDKFEGRAALDTSSNPFQSVHCVWGRTDSPPWGQRPGFVSQLCHYTLCDPIYKMGTVLSCHTAAAVRIKSVPRKLRKSVSQGQYRHLQTKIQGH